MVRLNRPRVVACWLCCVSQACLSVTAVSASDTSHVSLRSSQVRAASPSDAELVQSIPLETSLSLPLLADPGATWPAMIRGARSTLDVAQFYVYGGASIEPTLSALEAAGARGVRIRFLISGALLDSDTALLARLRGIRGLTMRILDLKRLTGGILHAKYWIVDGREVFIGSQNLDARSLSHIHEMGIRLFNQRIARDLAAVFAVDWRLAGGASPRSAIARVPAVPSYGLDARGRGARGRGDFELVASPPSMNPRGLPAALPALQKLIASARETVSIQLLTYSPVADSEVGDHTQFWPAIDNALRAAALRGVRVRLLVSDWNTSSPSIHHLKSLSLVPGISVRIATVPRHSSGFIPFARVIHSKYMVVDTGTLWIGTSNWSRSYFTSDRNVELIARRNSLAVQVIAVFETLWNSSWAEPIDVSRHYMAPVRG